MKTEMFDVLIVGGGMVGCMLALSLAQRTSLSIALLEANSTLPSWDKNNYHHRVSAITLSSQQIFSSLKIWDEISKKRVSPFEQIHVWDASTRVEIDFNCQDILKPLLGYIIENNLIQSVLYEKLRSYPQVKIILPIHLVAIQEKENSIELVSKAGKHFEGKLAIAADGANSWLRQAIGIPIEKINYQEQAIVSTVQTVLPHQRVARQVFGESGPLAFLPLNEKNVCSIVWSLPQCLAEEKLALEESQFKISLAQYFSYQLGEVISVGERYQFPLFKQQARSYVKSRVVLVGDAAHSIHPLAGQGVNMGIFDAAALSEVIYEAIKERRDFSIPRYLRRYERWRKADNVIMMNGIDVIKNLFGNNKLSMVRAMGLRLVNQLPSLKKFFMAYAVGEYYGKTNTLL